MAITDNAEQIFQHRGELYFLNSQNHIVRKYHCQYRDDYQCPARLWIWNDQRISPMGCHENHPSSAQNDNAQDVREREPVRPVDQPRYARNTNQHVSGGLPRVVRSGKPPVPRNLIEMSTMLNNYRPTSSIYQGSVTSSDDGLAFLFGNNDVLSSIGQEEEIFLDTSVDLIPRSPRLSHMLMILINRGSTTIPVLLCLCTCRSSALYVTILEFLQSRVPTLHINLQTVVASLERSLISAVRQSFPFCVIRPTWMQVMRNLTRCWCQNNLPLRLNDITLQQSWALPLIPHDFRDAAIRMISESSFTIEDEYPHVAIYVRYVQRMDLFLRSGGAITLNNTTEEFAQRLLRNCNRERPSIFVLLGRINSIVSSGRHEVIRSQSLALGNNQQDSSPSNLRIRNLQAALVSSQISIENFISNAVDVYQRELIFLSVSSETRSNINLPLFAELEDPGRYHPIIRTSTPRIDMNDGSLLRSRRISSSLSQSLRIRLLTPSGTSSGRRTSPPPFPLQSNPGPSSDHGTPLSSDIQSNASNQPSPGTSGEGLLQPSGELMMDDDDTLILESDDIEDEDASTNVVVTPVSQSSASKGVCCLCYEDTPIAAYNRCGHRCICEACFKRIFEGPNTDGDRLRCPICRQYSDAVIQIFDV